MFGDWYYTNPAHLVPPWAWEMMRLWRMSQGGMGVGHLPEGPASLDQSILMMDAFAVMSVAEADLKEEADDKPGVWTRRQIAETRAAVAAAQKLYPDGPATGALLDAVMRSRSGRPDPAVLRAVPHGGAS